MILKWHKRNFVSATKLAKIIKAHGPPYEYAYWVVSISNSFNFASVFLLIKNLTEEEVKSSTFLVLLIFFAPFFILNYYIFIKRKRYRKIIKEFESRTSHWLFIYYFLISFIIYGVSLFANEILYKIK